MLRVLGLLLLMGGWQLQAMPMNAVGRAASTAKRMIGRMSKNTEGSEHLRELLERLHSMRSKTHLSTRSNADANNLWNTPTDKFGMPTNGLGDTTNIVGGKNTYDDLYSTGVGDGTELGSYPSASEDTDRYMESTLDMIVIAGVLMATSALGASKKDKGKKGESKKDKYEEGKDKKDRTEEKVFDN